MPLFRIESLIFRLGTKRIVHGIPVAIPFLDSRKDEDLAFGKLNAALSMVERHCPEKYRTLHRDVKSILIYGVPSTFGNYSHDTRMIHLFLEHVLDPETTRETIASTLIHEAQHARLCRLGFGYDEPIRGRIEALCFRAERFLARRMPNGQAMVERAELWLSEDRTSYFSNESRMRARLDALCEHGYPVWALVLIEWIARWRLAWLRWRGKLASETPLAQRRN